MWLVLAGVPARAMPRVALGGARSPARVLGVQAKLKNGVLLAGVLGVQAKLKNGVLLAGGWCS